MPKPNYQREKRLKDLARQQKQEEKRAKRFQKESTTEGEQTEPQGEGTPETNP